MITPEDFPYIKSLYINDCYTYKDFNIELRDYKPFSHLILTGKNGSGKSTVLRHFNNFISYLRSGRDPVIEYDELVRAIREDRADHWPHSYKESEKLRLENLNLVKPISAIKFNKDYWPLNQNQIIYSFLKAKRNSQVNSVNTVSKESDFINQIQGNDSAETFVQQFKQYLVNKKVYQAFDQINNDQTRFAETDQFFVRLTESFRKIFEDGDLNLEFRQEDFEFFIRISDGRQITFDVLSEGFSALLSILMDLFMRVDLIRKQVNDYAYNPCGIVLIDEPETHLHLQLQEQILPLLTSLFPNVQFIAATHSPAVIASIKNATVFDLTTKESRGSEETVGRSYSDLMMSHFGLKNEYSETADRIIGQVNEVLNTLSEKPQEMKQALQKIYDEQSAYLSPTLKVELELLIAQQEAQQIAHQ